MDILKSLLRNLGRKWSQQPVEIPLLLIEKNQGVHSYATVETGQLHFHSMPYHPTIPKKQSIVLDDLTVQELLTTITSMGYTASLTSEAGNIATADLKAFILMEQRDIMLGMTLYAFTSTNWKLLYPIYRLLKQTEGDLEQAINQMYITTSKGKWLDYWATFFGIRRRASEEDSLFVRRMLMAAFSPKVNNTSMAEIIGFQLKSTVDVNDLQPLKFEVMIDADLMNAAEDTRKIIEDCKAAGVDYLLHYAKTFFEDYPLYIADKTGKVLKDSDKLVGASIAISEATYGWRLQEHEGGASFDLNADDLNGTDTLAPRYILMDEGWREMVQMSSEAYTQASEVLAMDVKLAVFTEAMAAIQEALTQTPTVTPMDNFRYADETGTIGFMLNVSDLNGTGKVTGENTSEAGSMTLVNSTTSTTVQTSQW